MHEKHRLSDGRRFCSAERTVILYNLSHMFWWHLYHCRVADRLLLVESAILHCSPFSGFLVEFVLRHGLWGCLADVVGIALH